MSSWSSIPLLPPPFLSLHLPLYLTPRMFPACTHLHTHTCVHTTTLPLPTHFFQLLSSLCQRDMSLLDHSSGNWLQRMQIWKGGPGCSPGQAGSSGACTGACAPWQPGPVAEKAGDRRAGTDIISCLAFSSRQAK